MASGVDSGAAQCVPLRRLIGEQHCGRAIVKAESALVCGFRRQFELELAERREAVRAECAHDFPYVVGARIRYGDDGPGLVELVEVSSDVRIRGIAYEYDVAGVMSSSGYVHGAGGADVVDDHELLFH
ncbi:hypothetical protein LO763_26570 [Glycomyces sp. A-F 0318]|uniref:hypothetical protein n=1 Tax=Glycomyces amatae TaxID=2881355 RepID=UPI001E2C4A6A|nr:hypothetical protein [Glycomyces amatae]MCD0447185.1 hypothetical protein [Glycomyces amatae]